MSDQPEALRLADDLVELDAQFSYSGLCGEAAAELRRQHDEIEQLKAERDALKAAAEKGTEYVLAHINQDLKAERDALVRKMSGYIVDAARYRWLRDFSPMFETVRKTKENIDAAIDAARGKT